MEVEFDRWVKQINFYAQAHIHACLPFMMCDFSWRNVFRLEIHKFRKSGESGKFIHSSDKISAAFSYDDLMLLEHEFIFSLDTVSCDHSSSIFLLDLTNPENQQQQDEVCDETNTREEAKYLYSQASHLPC